jgi:2-oxoisovalerate ferredoxin oxidoreductase beta subunit
LTDSTKTENTEVPGQEKVLGYPQGLYRTFTRKGGAALTATHYCPGCGHGVLHKLIGEALTDLGIQDRAVFISPVGCAVFGYYYFHCGNVQAAHGRAPAVGSGISRVAEDSIVISYQGDGDLCSIGLSETFHAANRGERIAIFFVNNAVYGMTGGQMAPTTLLGQKTTTSPEGRDPIETGYPVRACEVMDTLEAPVYIERVSLADARRIRAARRAVRKALQIQKERKGFTFVEFLSPCPTNMHADAVESANFVTEKMEPVFPLGCLRDRAGEAEPKPRRHPSFDRVDLDAAFKDYGNPGPDPLADADFEERRIRIAGFGGQGVLSLGLMLAQAGKSTGRFTTWIPSYGPEQRGGTANCSVAISGRPIGSPIFSETDVLVAMNQPSLVRFAPEVSPAGTILYEAAISEAFEAESARQVAVPALEIASKAGASKAANTVMLGVLAGLEILPLSPDSYTAALAETFSARPKLIPINQRVFEAGVAWAGEHIT